MFREVALYSLENRLRHFFLVALVIEPLFFFRIADERGLDQDRRDVRGFEHGEARLLGVRLVQGIDGAQLGKHRARQFEAVVDLGRLRQVEQGLREVPILDRDVDAAYQVGVVLLFCQPFCRA